MAGVVHDRAIIEILEARQMLHAVILSPIVDQSVLPSAAPTAIDLANRYDDADLNGTLVRLNTPQGDLYIDLYDVQKPNSVANFLSYVNSGAYTGTVIHSAGRLDNNNAAGRQFLETGAFALPDLQHIPVNAPVVDELTDSGVISNIRGTVALATPAGPGTATSEFLINLSDDSTYLNTRDTTNTVFGRLIYGSVSVADALAATPIYSFPNGFSSLPLTGYTGYPDALPGDSSFLQLGSATILPPYTLSVSTDMPGLVTPTIANNTLQLAYAPNATGTANVTVSVTSNDGGITQDTFAVQVAAPEDTSGTIITIGDGQALRSLVYTDADGTAGRISISHGTAAVHFLGTDIARTVKGTRATISGTNLGISTIDTTGTAGRGALVISASNGGDRQLQIDSITATESLSGVSASSVNLVGTSALVGDIASLRVNSLAGLTVAGSVGSFFAKTVSGNISISGDARSIYVSSMTGDLAVTGSARSIRVSSLTGKLQVNGELSSGSFVTLAGNVQVGSVRSFKTDDLTGNFSVAGDAESVYVRSGITGNTTIGGMASTLRLGTVNGNINVNGAARMIILSSVADSSINLGQNGGTNTKFTTGEARDVSLTSALPLSVLKAGSWIDTGGSVEAITAPGLNVLSIAGDFAPNLILNGLNNTTRTLTAATVRGQITGGTWNITGDVGRLYAGSIAAGWSEAISGTLTSFIVNSNLASNLDAGSIRSAVIHGDLSGNVTTRDAFDARSSSLGKLVVSGAMTNSFVQSSGSIGLIVAGAMVGTHIFAGASSTASQFPSALGDFVSPARIARVAVKSSASVTTFSDSTIAAASLGSMSLGSILSNNNAGVPFGVVGDVITSVVARTAGKTFAASKLLDPSQSLTLDDFQVRVL